MFPNNTSINPNGTSSPPMRSDTVVPIIIIHIIITIGIMGNTCIIAIVAMIKSMKTTTNLLLVNVAVADIVMLSLTALHMILARTIHFNNSFLCKVIDPNTFSSVALLATSATLTILAIERFNALVKPMKISRRLTLENIPFVIIGIWLLSTLMNLPIFIYLDYDPGQRMCSPGNNNGSLLISVSCIVLTMTIIPFIIIAFCYSKIIFGMFFSKTICRPAHSNPELVQEDLAAKKKLVKLLVAITVIFFIAFVPYGILQISIFGLTGAQKYNQDIVNLSKLVVYLIPLHSAINPFLYTLQSSNYRQGFRILIQRCLRRPRANRTSSVHRTIMTGVSIRNDEAEV